MHDDGAGVFCRGRGRTSSVGGESGDGAENIAGFAYGLTGQLSPAPDAVPADEAADQPQVEQQKVAPLADGDCKPPGSNNNKVVSKSSRGQRIQSKWVLPLSPTFLAFSSCWL